MSRKQTPLCLLCTIVERGGGQRAFRTYEKHGIALHYRISGEGTASSDLLDLLGFGVHCDRHSSPPRRSSDLWPRAPAAPWTRWWKKSTGTAPTCGPRAFCSCCR